jgi:hypothetical protein
MAITYGNSLTTYKEWRPLFLIILQQNPISFLLSGSSASPYLSPKTKHKTLELKLMSKKAYCKTPFGFLTSPPLPKPTQCFNLSKDINKAFKLWLISFRIYHNLLPFL